MQREIVSADNPTFYEHEATEMGVMGQNIDQNRFANPPYEGVLGQYRSEQNNPPSNGNYSRLIHTKMGGSQRQPQLRFATETMAYQKYSSLDLDTANNVTPPSSQTSPKANPNYHQYEDINQDGSELRLNWHENVDSITNNCYDDISIAINDRGVTQSLPQALNTVSTGLVESNRYKETNRLQVETRIRREMERDEHKNVEFMGEAEQMTEQNGSTGRYHGHLDDPVGKT